MFKKYLFILVIFLPILCIAQDGDYNDRLYLQNGSELRGKLIRYNGVDTVYFALSDTEILYFPGSMVKKIKMQGAYDPEEEIFKYKSSIWYIRSQVSLLYSKNNQGLSLSLSGGYHFNYWFSAGAGIGIDNYYTAKGHNIFPFFGEVRASLFKKNVTPYVAFRSGYGFVKADSEIGQTSARGGIFFNPVIGYRLGTGKPYVDIFVGARFQSAGYIVADSWVTSEFNMNFKRYDLGVGINF